jgi:hypothetical protein
MFKQSAERVIKIMRVFAGEEVLIEMFACVGYLQGNLFQEEGGEGAGLEIC